MGSSVSSPRAISFPGPRTLSTNPPDLIKPTDVWIYFPLVGCDCGLSYTNSGRGWWMNFDTQRDISSVRGVNGALAITFRPGQAAALILPQNSGSVLMGTTYKINVVNNTVIMVVPYNNVVTDVK